jgi:hypothetical protein
MPRAGRPRPLNGGNCYPPPVRRVTVLALAVILLWVAAACSGGATSSPSAEETTPLDTPSPAEPTPEESFPTEPPLVTSEPEESFPTEPPLVTSPPGAPVPVTSCSAKTDEQNFFAAVVAKVDWAVYCPGLPAGWQIVTGHRDVSGRGFLEISYRNRSGAGLQLREGAFCGQADGCVPAGEDTGAASFGDLTATVVAGSDGSWAIVVDRAAPVSWLLVGSSIDETTFRDLAANFLRVEP